jgi:DNA-binding MarR family transcriptional regulator
LARDPCIPPATLLLADFVPFRLNRLAEAVSRNLSEIYRRRFGLEIPEWRVLVTVGQRRDCTSQKVAASTRMHKTRVSRAVASLEQRNLIERAQNAADAREMPLQLTKAGRRMYAALVPLALERERRLLSCMKDAQRQEFVAGLSRLEEWLELAADE